MRCGARAHRQDSHACFQEVFGVPVKGQRLVNGENELVDDERTLVDSQVHDGDVMVLTRKPIE